MTRPDTSVGAISAASEEMNAIYIDFAADADALFNSAKRMARVSGWKYSTQKILCDLLPEIFRVQEMLKSGPLKQGEWHSFKLCERGHLRLVKALSAGDMLIQHTLVDAVLVPVLRRYLIHDNGASLEGKGIAFTRRRFEEHLHWHYRRYGTEGYVLKMDFRKYFDNIDHQKLLAAMAEKIPDARFLYLIEEILKANRPDVSYDPRTIAEIMQEPYSSLDGDAVDGALKDGSKLLPKSLGIGSPLSQIAGIFYPTRIDTYCKVVRGVHCYDAYMDDRIVVHPSKDFLIDLLAGVKDQAASMGLFIHPHKTQISRLARGVRFLNTRYRLTETGRVIRGIPRDVVVRERRKLKHLAKLVIDGKLDRAAFVQQYESWRGDKARYNAHGIIAGMDKLYKELLGVIDNGRKQRGNDGGHDGPPEERAKGV